MLIIGRKRWGARLLGSATWALLLSVVLVPSVHADQWQERRVINDIVKGLQPAGSLYSSYPTSEEALKQRAKSSTITGVYHEFIRTMYQRGEPFPTTGYVTVSMAKLTDVYPSEYLPTVGEIFETMARQTKSHIKHDRHLFSQWAAEPPEMPLPYTVTVPAQWKVDDRGGKVSYIPPAGQSAEALEIEMVGRYSGLDAEQEKRIRDALAVKQFSDQSRQAAPKRMTETKVDGCDALYSETDAGAHHKVRQWTFLDRGQGFVIKSRLPDSEKKTTLKLVKEVVASFRAVDPPPASPGL
ncbi:MAG TPA: hypothetical protein V6C72_04420 [Chroococcales cyanobacterium]